MGYQVKFYPRDNNLFLMAASDHRIYQVIYIGLLSLHLLINIDLCVFISGMRVQALLFRSTIIISRP
jgi:hypothetical protein